MKIEVPSGREFDFEGLGLLKMLLVLLWPLSNFFHCFVGSGRKGGAGDGGETLRENLSGLGGPLPMCTMLIVTDTQMQPQKQPLPVVRNKNAKLCRKVPRHSEKLKT